MRHVTATIHDEPAPPPPSRIGQTAKQLKGVLAGEWLRSSAGRVVEVVEPGKITGNSWRGAIVRVHAASGPPYTDTNFVSAAADCFVVIEKPVAKAPAEPQAAVSRSPRVEAKQKAVEAVKAKAKKVAGQSDLFG